MSTDVKVLFIAGWGRSGSTVLDNVLGEVDGFFSAGELAHLWDRGLLQNRHCGCGLPFGRCEVWQAVLARALDGPGSVEPDELARLANAGTRTRHLPLHVLGLAEPSARFRALLRRLYEAIRETTGCRVVVDSSKGPSYGRVLATTEGIDVRAVHLVRDPRASAYSWMRPKIQPDEGRPRYMHQHGVAYSSLMWDVYNVGAEMLWRRERDHYLRIRYEDFVARPQEIVRRVLAFVDEAPGENMPWVSDRTVHLTANHTISGNPSRFRTGPIDLRADDEWRARMRLRQKVAATILTLPLLARYSYEVACRRPPNPI
ncbi:MAG TPA: sulfotransferase [Gaiellaceae bacterium]|nr:sulfotransferase [Gaiellaceae bacterium]